jgi:hypothetical protein
LYKTHSILRPTREAAGKGVKKEECVFTRVHIIDDVRDVGCRLAASLLSRDKTSAQTSFLVVVGNQLSVNKDKMECEET